MKNVEQLSLSGNQADMARSTPEHWEKDALHIRGYFQAHIAQNEKEIWLIWLAYIFKHKYILCVDVDQVSQIITKFRFSSYCVNTSHSYPVKKFP